MNSTIENLLKTWKEKVEIQERHYQLTAKEYDNLKKKNQEEIQDRFPWLSLKTK